MEPLRTPEEDALEPITEAETLLLRAPATRVDEAANPGRDAVSPQESPRDPDARARADKAAMSELSPIVRALFDDPKIVRRYGLRDLLGSGGMGEVHTCRDKRIGREVALKVLRTGGSDSVTRARFLREARVQGQLEHPAVVPVYDLGGTPGGGLYFTMKRVRGLTLEQIIAGLSEGDEAITARYSRRRLLTAFVQLCLAVDFAHVRGVLHRDLKPSNLMLGDFGEVHVLDWGLAKILGMQDLPRDEQIDVGPAARAATLTGQVMGTPGFMSPEQVRGEVETLDARADVFALGAILFELLTLTPLVPMGPVQGMLVKTLAGVDARASERAPEAEVAPELEAICVRATETDRAARYESARELSEAIERYLDGDRDLTRRRELARTHAEAARVSLEGATGGAEAERASRADAMRELTRALALDPGNEQAVETLAWVLMNPPSETPPEVESELEELQSRSRSHSARTGTLAYLTWLLFAPFLVWMGVRNYALAGVTVALVVACSGLAYWLGYRVPQLRPKHGIYLFGLSTLAILTLAGIVGPFLFLPSLLLVNNIFFALHVDRPMRIGIGAIGLLVILGPFALSLMGVLPPFYDFHDGVLTVLPHLLNFPKVPTLVSLSLLGAAFALLPVWFGGLYRDALAAAERRVLVQSWQLRQMVPAAARGAYDLGGRERAPGRRSSSGASCVVIPRKGHPEM